MKKKLIIVLVVLLAVGGFAAKTFLLKSKPAKLKVSGEVYILPHQFTLNLADGHYATLSAALVLGAGQSDGASAAGGGTSTDSIVGTLPEEAVIRDIITNDITAQSSAALTSASGRDALKAKILADILAHTDDKIVAVLFPDVAVQ